MKISKKKLNLMVPLLCYVLTIATAFFQSNSMRYIMYGVVISIACIEELQKKKADKWAKEFPYLLLYVVIIEVITIIREIYENNTIDPGSIIQPVFLISCLIMGFNVGKKYGEAGCKDLLIFFSVIFIIAALVCVPEYVLKKSLFFPSYGNAWDAFRTPSIYGHPIRVGTSLKVLFVGLPCQVEAVKCYVGEKLDNSLYTVDLICHGSPSPKVLDMFLAQYDIDTPKLSDIQFRNKNNFAVREGTSYIVQKGVLDKYSISFLNSISYTENCYHCQYANIMRVSDITLGDSWGSNLDIQEQRKGISLILNQTQKGKELLEQSELELMDVELNRAIEHNHQLRHPSIKPNTREIFFGEIKNGKNFNAIVRKLYPKQSAKQLVKMLLIKAKIMGGV